ncbi:MAG: hemerythrin domain-containing protein, partial [Thiomonas sp.]
REESELLPMAKRLLGEEQLQEIGKAMQARRGAACETSFNGKKQR